MKIKTRFLLRRMQWNFHTDVDSAFPIEVNSKRPWKIMRNPIKKCMKL